VTAPPRSLHSPPRPAKHRHGPSRRPLPRPCERRDLDAELEQLLAATVSAEARREVLREAAEAEATEGVAADTVERRVRAHSRPTEARVLPRALRELPWPRIVLLALADSVKPSSSFDTGIEWFAANAAMGKSSVVRAISDNRDGGQFVARWTTPKTVNGRTFDATHYRVADEWSTQKEKAGDDVRWVLIDQDFIRRHPKASGDTCKVYHVIAHEQVVYGACELRTTEIAWLAGITGTATQTPAQKVSAAIRWLRNKGEIAGTKGKVIYAPHYPLKAKPDELTVGKRRRAAIEIRNRELRQAKCDAGEPANKKSDSAGPPEVPKSDSVGPPFESLTFESESLTGFAGQGEQDQGQGAPERAEAAVEDERKSRAASTETEAEAADPDRTQIDELIAELRPKTSEKGQTLIDRLVEDLGFLPWPPDVEDVAEELFGGAIRDDEGFTMHHTKTYKALDRRILHAFREWDFRYGPLHPRQHAFAVQVLVDALRAAARDAGGNRGKLHAFVKAGIDRAINHEDTHNGFTRLQVDPNSERGLEMEQQRREEEEAARWEQADERTDKAEAEITRRFGDEEARRIFNAADSATYNPQGGNELAYLAELERALAEATA
jgi:hypothetical protein